METADEKTYRKYRNKRSVIVKIDIELIKWKYPNVANSAYDLSNSNNRNCFLENDRQKSFAGAYSEIAFKHSIPSEAVSVCYTTEDGYVNRKRRQACVTQAISSEAVLPRTTQYLLNQPNNTTKSNLSPMKVSNPNTLKGINDVIEKSSSKLYERVGRTRDRDDLFLPFPNPETGSSKSSSHSNQTQHLFGYSGYNDVFDYEKSYQPSKIQPTRRNQSEPKHHSTFGNAVDYERSHQPYKTAIPSPEVRSRDSNNLTSTNLEPRSQKSSFRSTQVPDLYGYLGYGNVSKQEESYQPSKVSFPSQNESRTRVKSDFNSTTWETERDFTQNFLYNQAVEQSDYSAYDDLIDYASIYQPSNLPLTNQATKTSNSIKPSTHRNQSEPKYGSIFGDIANYEEYYQHYGLEVPIQENRKRDKVGVSSSNFETANSSRPSIPARPLKPSLRKDLSEPRDYSSYAGSYQPRKLEVSGMSDGAHDRTRQSSTDFQSLNPSIYSPPTEQPQPPSRHNPAYPTVLGYEGSYQPNRSAIPSQLSGTPDRTRQSSTDFGTSSYSRPYRNRSSPDAPRNKPLWKKVFSFFSRPFKSSK